MTKQEDIEVCICTGATYGEIMEAIKKGACTIEAIGDETDAGTVCGLCKSVEEDELGEREIHLDEILKAAKREGYCKES